MECEVVNMKELLNYIVANLVTVPQAVSINEKENSDEIIFELRVAQEDMGRIIGRHGRIAKEIRTIMKSVGNRENKKVSVEICD